MCSSDLEQVGLDSEDEFEDTPAEEGEWCEQFDELAEFDEFCEFDELDDLGSECDVEHEELQCRGFEGSYTSASSRSEEHTSELQSRLHLVCRLLLEKKKKKK